MKQNLMILLVLAMAFLVGNVSGLRTQWYTIRLKLMCGDRPESGADVKLMEKDYGIDPDDEFDKGKTNAQGMIELSGSGRELPKIEPYVEIYSNCDNGSKSCPRKWTFILPRKYISGETMDLGTINMEMKMPDEKQDC